MQRVLSPGGIVCFTTWKFVAGMPLAMESFKNMQFRPPRQDISKLPWHEKEYLEKIMKEHGFTNVKIEEANSEFKVPEAELIKFGYAMSRNPVFLRLLESMSKEQKEAWPQAIVKAAKSMYGQKDTYEFLNIAYIVTGKKA